jgi:hypothetical protein
VDRARVELIRTKNIEIMMLQISCPVHHRLSRMMHRTRNNKTKVRSEADKETTDLSLEGRLVHCKLEQPS